MSHNRKQCVALYLEEYEELVLECYWTARSKEKMVNNRHRFFCIHCKESHKDKNTTSYHRMFRLCPVYKGTKALKMYPTWDKSEQGEKQRIGLKYGKRDSPTMPTAPTIHASASSQPRWRCSFNGLWWCRFSSWVFTALQRAPPTSPSESVGAEFEETQPCISFRWSTSSASS